MSPGPAFLGYLRPDGRVGVRNHVLVVPTVICSAVVAAWRGFGTPRKVNCSTSPAVWQRRSP